VQKRKIQTKKFCLTRVQLKFSFRIWSWKFAFISCTNARKNWIGAFFTLTSLSLTILRT